MSSEKKFEVVQLELMDCIKTNNILRFSELIHLMDPYSPNTILLEEAIRLGNRYFAGVLAFKMKYNTRVDWEALKKLAEETGDRQLVDMIIAHGAQDTLMR